jgi:hypothetical protein
VRLVELPAAAWEWLLTPATGLLCVLLITFAYYAPYLDDWFFADDFWFLRNSQTTGWGTWLLESFDYRDADPVPQFNEYRPFYVITFKLQYALFGLHAWAYHAFNVAVHLGCVALLWLLVRKITERVWPAHLAALIFGVHFAYGDAVRWVVNGNTPLAAFFYLAAFLFFVSFARAEQGRWWYYGAFFACLVTALLYHSVALPLVVALVAWYFGLHLHPRDALRPASWLPFLPVAAFLVPYVAIHEWVHQHYAHLEIAFRIDWHVYDNYIRYFSLSAYPVDLHDGTAVYVSAAMLVLCGFLLTQWRWSLLAPFAVLWYFSALAPSTTLILGAYGRLLYVAGLPLAFLLTVVAMRLVDFLSERNWSGLKIATLLPYLALLLTVPAAALTWKLQDIAAKTFPGDDYSISRQSDANRELLDGLRAQFPDLPQNGALYVYKPPANLIVFGDEPLDNLVEVYYGEVDVRSAPPRDQLALKPDDIRATLGPNDVLFVFSE